MSATPHYPWKGEYTVGNEFIDKQHRTLLELAGLLHAAVATGQGYKVIQAAYTALVKYTNEHFSAEERFWNHAKSETLAHHRREHREITEELAGLRQESEYGVVFCTPNELANWMERRLIAHFIAEDQNAYQALVKTASAPAVVAGARR